MIETQPSHDELVYAPTIVILANDLYPRKLEIVREYIQNASDAIDAFLPLADYLEDHTLPQIKISIQGKSLLIWDNGIGMDASEIQKLKRIAYSEKQDHEAGYKGIGRLAGIAVATKLLISSTSFGDPKLHKFEFRARDLVEEIAENKRKGIQETATTVINRHTTISSFDVDPAEHYTLVELRDISEQCGELLDVAHLREFIGDIGPVGFRPSFPWAETITEHLYKNVPGYSAKTIWLTTEMGTREQVYKPYSAEMSLSKPGFIEIDDPNNRDHLLAYCWHSTKAKQVLGKTREAGGKFSIVGDTPEAKKRLAGLIYKLAGLTVGDRSLPLRTLWEKDYTRALWFTGEIHIVDRAIKPTTDRSDFIDNDARRRLYESARQRVAKRLNTHAEEVSKNRIAHDKAEKWDAKFAELRSQLDDGGIDRAELKSRKREIHEARENLKITCKDKDVLEYVKRIDREARSLEKRLDEAPLKKNKGSEIGDLPKEVEMTSQARKVYMIIMQALEDYFRDDIETYYEISAKVQAVLRKKY